MAWWPHPGNSAPPAVPAPLDAQLARRIDTLALFAARNGPAFVDFTREQQRGNDEFEFLEGGEGASYFDFRLHEAVLEASGTGERHWGEVDDAAGEGGGGGGRGGQGGGGGGLEQRQQQQRQQHQPPRIDAFDLPAGLIPELVNAARTAGCRPHAPIRAEDAEGAAKVAAKEEEAEDEKNTNFNATTPYLSARLAALEAELEAYVPGMTRADLEEKLAKVRGEATRGSGWEAVMRRRAAEESRRAGAVGVGGGMTGGEGPSTAAKPGDDGRFEGPRWLDRAGVGFEFRGGKKGKESGAAKAAAANAANNDASEQQPSLLDSDLASFREHQSRAYHEDGRERKQRNRR